MVSEATVEPKSSPDSCKRDASNVLFVFFVALRIHRIHRAALKKGAEATMEPSSNAGEDLRLRIDGAGSTHRGAQIAEVIMHCLWYNERPGSSREQLFPRGTKSYGARIKLFSRATGPLITPYTVRSSPRNLGSTMGRSCSVDSQA